MGLGAQEIDRLAKNRTQPGVSQIQGECLEVLEKLESVQENALMTLRGPRPRNEVERMAERQINVLDDAQLILQRLHAALATATEIGAALGGKL